MIVMLDEFFTTAAYIRSYIIYKPVKSTPEQFFVEKPMPVAGTFRINLYHTRANGNLYSCYCIEYQRPQVTVKFI